MFFHKLYTRRRIMRRTTLWVFIKKCLRLPKKILIGLLRYSTILKPSCNNKYPLL